jgi:general L-amino acid transport system substrate-binding protein
MRFPWRPSRILRALCVPALAFAFLSQAQTLPQIRQTKTLTCAIDQAPLDYTTLDLHGPRIAFDLELCHAVAIAIAGPDAKVRPLLLPDEASTLAALKSHKANLVPTASLDFTNATTPGLFFGPPILQDGTGFLIRPDLPADTPESLSGKKLCFFAETETETILRTWFTRNHLDFVPYPFSEEGEMQAAFMSGNCPAIAADLTRLAALREGAGSVGAHARILPVTIAPDPLGPAAADPALLRIATWVYELLLNAQALGVTRATLPQLLGSDDPALQRLFNRTHELAKPLGLDEAWTLRVLTAIGSYADLATRTLSGLPVDTPTPLPLR